MRLALPVSPVGDGGATAGLGRLAAGALGVPVGHLDDPCRWWRGNDRFRR